MSIRSLHNFAIINGYLYSLGYTQYVFMTYYKNMHSSIHPFFIIYFLFILRNYMLLALINNSIKSKPAIIDNSQLPIEKYPYEFHVNIFVNTAVESITHVFIEHYLIQHDFSIWDPIYFIPQSFIFELIFDFFHYFSHRCLHHPLIYKYLHKKHHTFHHPTTIITFYQDPIDLIITNSVPTIIALSLYNISYFQFHSIIVYKTFIEIGGHSGKKIFPTSSFPQCVWLPKMFHIELYTEDHDLHHSQNNCNYAKRFSLWDKLFGTYICQKRTV